MAVKLKFDWKTCALCTKIIYTKKQKMKFLKYIVIVAIATQILSCTSNNDEEILEGEGTVELKFDNAFNGSDLILNNTAYEAVGTEKIKISTVKYIVSNISLEDSEGNVFTYPKESSYFIIDEADATSQKVSLSNIPAGNYTKVTFGIGVDQETYSKGAEGQGELLAKAQEMGMMWSWQAGYKFFRFEGNYTSSSVNSETTFAFHMGSHGSNLDNYKEVTLPFPNTIKVKTDATPSVHIVANIAKVLDAETAFLLEDDDQIHVDAVKSPKIASNVSQMFMVHHVHN
jgi:hypothetical protein